jgi:hypothetical protein
MTDQGARKLVSWMWFASLIGIAGAYGLGAASLALFVALTLDELVEDFRRGDQEQA